MPRKEERTPFDLRTLRHIMEKEVGPGETPDTAPVLRSDVLDAMQRYLAKCHHAQVALEQSGYYGILDEATAILADNPEVRTFLSSIRDGLPAAAYAAITDIGQHVTG